MKFSFSSSFFWLSSALVGVTVTSAAHADPIGPRLYTFASSEASGFVSNLSVSPASRGDCSLWINSIDRHGAGEQFSGWQINFAYKDPRPGSEAGFHMELFWDKVAGETPFADGFDYAYSYYLYNSDPIERVIGQFDAAAGMATFQRSGFFVVFKATVYLSDDRRTIQSVEYVRMNTLFPSPSASLKCVAQPQNA